MIYDHVIIGAGLSGLLKAESLMTTLPQTQRVLLLDPDPQNVSLRTFCVWRKKTDLLHPHHNLVSHRYDQYRITSGDPYRTTSGEQKSGSIKSFEDFTYERISGAAFYKHMHQKIFSDPRFELQTEAVLKVNESKQQVEITTQTNKKISAKKVWNSLCQGKPDMLQHFFGFEIETPVDFFNPSLVDLMDFRVEQKNEVRFIYILPYSPRKALVEFTVFSKALLEATEYEAELKLYLAKYSKLPEFKVTEIEKGVIPMTLDPWPLYSSPMGLSRISPIGGAAGRIKASTGYSFMKNQTSERSTTQLDSFSWRFRLYDTLLLGIMRSKGAEISKIFPKLFSQNSSDVLFRFLDEKTKFSEELKIFVRLPWKNFLIQTVINFPFFIASTTLIILGLVLAPVYSPPTTDMLLNIAPALGLLAFGISHGAIDHILNPEISKLRFYCSYNLGLLGFFAVWMVAPLGALALFILIASDHFGENQFLRALKISNNQLKVRLLAGLWGLAASLVAPLFHWDSAKAITQVLLRDETFGNWLLASEAQILGFALSGLALVSAQLITQYESNALARKLPGVLSSAFLFFTFWQLPLLPGFLTFFCFWHSWDTINQQRKALDWSPKKYFKEAAPYSVLAIVFLMSTVLIFDHLENLWSYLFLLLGALTVSHSFVIKRFYKF